MTLFRVDLSVITGDHLLVVSRWDMTSLSRWQNHVRVWPRTMSPVAPVLEVELFAYSRLSQCRRLGRTAHVDSHDLHVVSKSRLRATAPSVSLPAMGYQLFVGISDNGLKLNINSSAPQP